MLPRNPAQGRQRAKRGERKRGEVIGSYFYWLFVDGDDGRLHGAADAGRKRTRFGPGFLARKIGEAMPWTSIA
jgi:hypothetical protein